MKSATVREIQHNLAAVLRQVESGEEFQILRRNRPVAMIVPVRDKSNEQTADWSKHKSEIDQIFGGKTVSGKPISEIVSDGRGDN